MRRHHAGWDVETLECTSGRELLTVVEVPKLTIVYWSWRQYTRGLSYTVIRRSRRFRGTAGSLARPGSGGRGCNFSRTAAALDGARVSLANGEGIPQEEILREFGLMK
jgi:hypothetical protein